MKKLIFLLFLVFESNAIYVSCGTAAEIVYGLLGENIIIGNVQTSFSPSTAGLYQNNNEMAGNLSELHHGIVLSSGDVFKLNTNQNTTDASTLIGLPGDNDLESFIGEGINTYDASWIEFDFTPTVTGTMYFTYQFASEEYFFGFDPSYELYRDVFAVLLDGTNIATLPNGENIGINTVNEYDNSEYFNGNNYGEYATEVNGFIDGFILSMQVEAWEDHHMKLSICDARDPWYDSYVMFGKNSLKVLPNIPDGMIIKRQYGVDEPSNKVTILFGIFAILIYVRRKKCLTI